MKWFALIVAVLVVVASSMRPGPVAAQPRVEVTGTLEEQIEQFIDPEIVGEDRRVLIDHMRRLPKWDWDEVIYVQGDRIYVNRVRLRQHVAFAEHIRGGLYGDPFTGEVFPAPSDSP
jgi:hypothetical protein